MTILGGQKVVRLAFDSDATKEIFSNHASLYTQVDGNDLTLIPVANKGRSVKDSANHSSVYSGDLVDFNDKSETAKVDLISVRYNTIDFFPHPNNGYVRKSGYGYTISYDSSSDDIGTVNIAHVDAYDPNDILNISLDFNSVASRRYFDGVLAERQSGNITTGIVELMFENDRTLIRFDTTNSLNAITSKVWAKGSTDNDNSFKTVKATVSLEQATRLNLIAGWRYLLEPTFEDGVYKLTQKSEIKFFGHREQRQMPIVSLSVTRK